MSEKWTARTYIVYTGDGGFSLHNLPKGEERAALIVKAVNSHDALLAFFKWAMREGPWDGCDLDGAAVQDKAEALGLIVKTQYDAEKHGVQSDFEQGDDWFEYAPHILADVGGEKA